MESVNLVYIIEMLYLTKGNNRNETVSINEEFFQKDYLTKEKWI